MSIPVDAGSVLWQSFLGTACVLRPTLPSSHWLSPPTVTRPSRLFLRMFFSTTASLRALVMP